MLPRRLLTSCFFTFTGQQRAAIAEKVPRGIHFSAANCIGPGARPIQGPGWRPACGTEIGGPGYPRSDVSAEKWGPKRDPSETVYGELNENLRLKDVRMPTPRMLYEASSVKFESAASAPQAALLEQMYEQASEAFAAGRDQPDTVLQTDDYNRSHAPNWGTPPFEDQVDDVIYGPLSLKQPEMTVPTPGMEEEASMHGVKPLLGVDAAAAMASEAPVAPVAIGSETFSVLPAAFDSADSSSRVLPVQDSARIGPLTGHQLAADAQAATTASRSAGFGVTGAPTWQSPSASSAAASTTIAEAEAAATIPGVTGETSSTTLTEPNEYRDEFEVGRRNPNALG